MLRTFGANITGPSRIYPGARVWIPSNLTINGRSSVADGAYIYNIAPVVIGNNVVISQGACICTGTHNYNSTNIELLCAPIVIHDEVWLAANCFVHPGVTIGEGAVLGACSVIVKDVASWGVFAGNPAALIKQRQVGCFSFFIASIFRLVCFIISFALNFATLTTIHLNLLPLD